MRRSIIFLGSFAVAALLTACAPKNTVVLVPDPDGAVGQITVSNAGGSVDIDTANQYTVVKDQATAPDIPEKMDQAKIQNLFGKALAIQPPPPIHFILYFRTDSTDLRSDSVEVLPNIIAAIRERGSERISVVGHTDTSGGKEYNLKLSTRRAQAVRNRLVEMGIADTLIEVTSHGEENPLIKTGDNVRNAKNRRVEVVVR
jgi:outer membrane protein OmpA-like peptidoglycan-associated protein